MRALSCLSSRIDYSQLATCPCRQASLSFAPDLHNHIRENVQTWGPEWGCSCERSAFTPKCPEWSFAMRPTNTLSTRRKFLQASAVATISAAVPASNALAQLAPNQTDDDVFQARQAERRKELWGLLGACLRIDFLRTILGAKASR